ncbi:Annexin A11 [Bienertia sinuspersici]
MSDPKYGYPYPAQGYYQGQGPPPQYQGPPVMAPPQYQYGAPPPPQQQSGQKEKGFLEDALQLYVVVASWMSVAVIQQLFAWTKICHFFSQLNVTINFNCRRWFYYGHFSR